MSLLDEKARHLYKEADFSGTSFLAGLIGSYWQYYTARLNTFSQTRKEPQLAYNTNNMAIVPSMEAGWLARVCGSQQAQAEIFVATIAL